MRSLCGKIDHINDVLNNNRHQPNNPLSTVPEKNIVILLPHLDLQSNQVAKRLESSVYKFYSCANLEIIFGALYSAANDPRLQMIPKLDRK